jgi:hypothetical protein
MRTRVIRPVLLAGATAGLAVAGCAAPGQAARTPGGSSAASAVSPAPTGPPDYAAEAAANRAAADKEAARLLSLAPVPPGATALPVAVGSGLAPGAGVISRTATMDHASYWLVPMPIDQTAAWEQAHAPAGLHADGQGSGGGPGGATSVSFGYEAPDGPGWTGATLGIDLVSDGDTRTQMRIDGLAAWLDPQPQVVASSGPRITITVAGGCPAAPNFEADVANAGADLSWELLPAASPTAGLICAYSASGQPPAHRALDAIEAASVAAAARGLSLTHVDGSKFNCPADTGGVTIVVFRYPGRSDVALHYATAGCPSVDNGVITTAPDDAFTNALEKLLPEAGGP